ncbi:hypothetical protein A0I81_10200 [Listeria monocytogenes]|uniref:hypothetical protein n=1 Tax=Listeria monocytogenes TaxID=1639 RepID=UPI000BDF44B1|nr:hypothetical protein [Listeria monocytogenes]EAE2750778.1 hypothetical protein [Listeria monocytogenes]EAE4263390.1 hypothetical protein [Listeria monocytogenes]EAE4811140.1 hypothetical protein [Listeria monocytogenes]EAE5205015.1 hypothetical protein [Listeria monocytogenes]EAE5559690.1 hypothetical protein [Listeria monocytogenes]
MEEVKYIEITKKIPGTPFNVGNIYELERMGSANARVRFQHSIYQIPKEALEVVKPIDDDGRWKNGL